MTHNTSVSGSVADRILISCICIYICMMFLTMGEAVRNILLSVSFIAWLYTLRQRDLSVLKSSVAVFFWLYCASILLSTVFSLDRLYSLSLLSGEPRKAVMLFPMLATAIDTEKKAKLMLYSMAMAALVVVGLGYYTYFFTVRPPDHPYFTAYIYVMHVGSEKYGGIMVYLLSFVFSALLIRHKRIVQLLIGALAIAVVLALLLSAARAAYLSFFFVCLILMVFGWRRNRKMTVKILVGSAAGMVLIAALSLSVSPHLRTKLSRLSEDISTGSNRGKAWTAAGHGFMQRPLFGWGYGKKIFQREEPYRDTPIKTPPRHHAMIYDDAHSTFLMVLFHQGLAGFIPYLLFITFALIRFWRHMSSHDGIVSVVLLACVAALLGDYVVYSQFSYVKLQHLAVLLGLGMGLCSIQSGNTLQGISGQRTRA